MIGRAGCIANTFSTTRYYLLCCWCSPAQRARAALQHPRLELRKDLADLAEQMVAIPAGDPLQVGTVPPVPGPAVTDPRLRGQRPDLRRKVRIEEHGEGQPIPPAA